MIPGLWGAPLKAISAFAPPLYTQDFNLYNDEVHAAFTDYDLGMAYAADITVCEQSVLASESPVLHESGAG